MLIFCAFVFVGLLGLLLFLNRAGAQKRDDPATQPPAMTTPSTSNDKSAKPVDAELRKKLTPEQYHVTQMCGTEPPFQNAYWNEHRDGIYVDIVSGDPLFIRQRHRLAEFHQADRQSARGGEIGSHAWHGTDRGPFEQKRFAPRPCFPRWSGADRSAILHQFGRAAIRSSGKIKGRRLRRLSRAFREEEVTVSPGELWGDECAQPPRLVGAIY